MTSLEEDDAIALGRDGRSKARRALAVALLLAGALAAGGAYWWAHRPPPPPPPDRQLFATVLPHWILARARKELDVESRASSRALARPWPQVVEALDSIDQAFPDVEKTKGAVAKLNTAAHASGLDYWVDVVVWNNTPYLLSYEIAARHRWRLRDVERELLQVRRIDRITIEMGYIGHAGGDQPVVLLDRLEPSVLESLGAAYAEEPEGNEVDKAATAHWRKALQAMVGEAAMSKAAAQVKHREGLFAAMRGHLKGGVVLVAQPDRFDWGDAFFESLEPATRYDLRGGPLLLSTDVRDLRHADAALQRGEGRRALEAALDLEARATEAHEARHALDRSALPIPAAMLQAAGDDDLDFARSSERELRAYLGQLHDAEAPPCITLTRLAVLAGGERARETPHHFASQVILAALGSTGEGLPAFVDTLCALPEAQLRERAEAAYLSLYGQPLEPARRVEGGAGGCADAGLP